MFERYTEDARRVVFFGRYEASAAGAHEIATPHLLLGMLREAHEFVAQFLSGHSSVDALRTELTACQRPPVSHVATPVDLPLSFDSKRVLAHASEEAEQLSHRIIGVRHFLLALLRDPTVSPVLQAHGVTRDKLLARTAPGEADGATTMETQRVFRGNLVTVSETLEPGDTPGSMHYSVEVRAFGQLRSWRTTFHRERL